MGRARARWALGRTVRGQTGRSWTQRARATEWDTTERVAGKPARSRRLTPPEASRSGCLVL
eukprot:776876-Rhodomonas_salina.3